VHEEADTVTSFSGLVDTCVVASHKRKKDAVIPAGAFVFLFCLLFIAVAVSWIDKPGMQTDEVLFAGGIYPPFDERFIVRIFGHEVPIMVMSYVGALKAHIWAAIFAVWPPSPASVRIPAALLGALSIWWTYLLMARTLGGAAGLVGAALLATDRIYIPVFALGPWASGDPASLPDRRHAGSDSIRP